MLDSILDQLETAINEVSDKNWSWWPFLWLRPAKESRLSLRRLVAMTALYGLPLALAIATLYALALPRERALEGAAAAVTGVLLAFLLHMSVVVGPMWNRRAERLARRNVWRR